MPRGGARPNTGGKRPGAGRKPGAVTVKTREVANAIILKGDSPLEVMVAGMRHYRDNGQIEEALAVAKDAAPYCHAKLAAVMVADAAKNGEIVIARLGLNQAMGEI